jgi:hypothetical protein
MANSDNTRSALQALALVSAPGERISFRKATEGCESFLLAYERMLDDPALDQVPVEALAMLSAWQRYFMHHHPNAKERAVFMDGWLKTWGDLDKRGYQQME